MEQGDQGSDDLRTRLHAMESKLSRIRSQRDSHNDSARSAAEQRNSAHEKRKEVHETITTKMDEQKKVRAQAKIHQASRDEIQQSIREILARKKGTRDQGPGKSVVIQLSETVGEIERIEDRIMTDGSLTPRKREFSDQEAEVIDFSKGRANPSCGAAENYFNRPERYGRVNSKVEG